MKFQLTESDIAKSYWDGDPYLNFGGPVSDKTPKEFIALIDTIRKESEWRKIFPKIKKDKNGNYDSINKNGLIFTFYANISAGELELKAIETGKKLTQHPTSVYALLYYGSSYDDFAIISPDVIAFCEAQKLLEKKEVVKALAEIEKATKLKPDENLYATLYFQIRLDLKDESSISEELKYFENDIDCLVHSERVYKWIRFLVKGKKYNTALQLIHTINQLLDELISGKRIHRIFGNQDTSFYEYNKDKFNKRIEKTLVQIESKLNATK